MLREDTSPRTQRIASEIFDFPLPLGPMITVAPLPNSSLVLSGKDLNPCISIDFKYKRLSSLSFVRYFDFCLKVAQMCAFEYFYLSYSAAFAEFVIKSFFVDFLMSDRFTRASV